MTRTLDRLEALASIRTIVLLVLIVVICGAVLFPRAYGQLERLSGYAEPLDMKTGFTPDEAYDLLGAYGDEGRAIYVRTALTVDTLFPLANALLLACIAVRLLGAAFPGSPSARLPALVPAALLIADLAENLSIVLMAWRFPERSDAIARFASAAGVAKWISVGAGMLVVVLALVAFVARSRPTGGPDTDDGA